MSCATCSFLICLLKDPHAVDKIVEKHIPTKNARPEPKGHSQNQKTMTLGKLSRASLSHRCDPVADANSS